MSASPPDDDDEVGRLYQIQQMSPVDSRLELLDPSPNIHHLFMVFEAQFFWGKLKAVEVKWSPRMTQCAGICRYHTRSGHCTIGLSKPLLTLRPRKDLVETLLHEMIHAYLFVTRNNKDRDGHGPEFHKHMYRINNATGANITVYHTFHDEVRAQKVHVWRCQGPCKNRPPYWGYVRRSMNRAPGPSDFWHTEHRNTCGGEFVKILEPPNFKNKNKKVDKKTEDSKMKNTPKITTMLPKASDTFTPFSGKGYVLGREPGNQNNKKPIFRSTPKKKKPKGTLDISNYFSKSNNDTLNSPSKRHDLFSGPLARNNKKPKLKFSPVKKPNTIDIASLLNKSNNVNSSFSDSISDTELLILTPPKKKKKIHHEDASSSSTTTDIQCPICKRRGFKDLNSHVNHCISLNQCSPSSSGVNTSNGSITQSQIRSQVCSICNKSIMGKLEEHIEVCIASIPCDSDEGEGWEVETGNISHDIISLDPQQVLASHRPAEPQSSKVSQPPSSQNSQVLDTSVIVIEDESDSCKNNTATVECPVCCIDIDESIINQHLDACLGFC